VCSVRNLEHCNSSLKNIITTDLTFHSKNITKAFGIHSKSVPSFLSFCRRELFVQNSLEAFNISEQAFMLMKENKSQQYVLNDEGFTLLMPD
jgi:hypothetical protein